MVYVTKVVFSTTVTASRWNNTIVANRNLGDEIVNLKSKAERHYCLWGSKFCLVSKNFELHGKKLWAMIGNLEQKYSAILLKWCKMT
jgi:hypothetical protein